MEERSASDEQGITIPLGKGFKQGLTWLCLIVNKSFNAKLIRLVFFFFQKIDNTPDAFDFLDNLRVQIDFVLREYEKCKC